MRYTIAVLLALAGCASDPAPGLYLIGSGMQDAGNAMMIENARRQAAQPIIVHSFAPTPQPIVCSHASMTTVCY